MRRVLRPAQIDRLSEFTANLGLVFIASVIAPLFSPDLAPVNFIVVILGVVSTAACLVVSLFLIKGVKR